MFRIWNEAEEAVFYAGSFYHTALHAHHIQCSTTITLHITSAQNIYDTILTDISHISCMQPSLTIRMHYQCSFCKLTGRKATIMQHFSWSVHTYFADFSIRLLFQCLRIKYCQNSCRHWHTYTAIR